MNNIAFNKSILQFNLNLLDHRRQSVILVKKVFLGFRDKITTCNFYYNAFWKSRILTLVIKEEQYIRICFDDGDNEISIYFYYQSAIGGSKCQWVSFSTKRTIKMLDVDNYVNFVRNIMKDLET